jgi:hypothetical protein
VYSRLTTWLGVAFPPSYLKAQNHQLLARGSSFWENLAKPLQHHVRDIQMVLQNLGLRYSEQRSFADPGVVNCAHIVIDMSVFLTAGCIGMCVVMPASRYQFSFLLVDEGRGLEASIIMWL